MSIIENTKPNDYKHQTKAINWNTLEDPMDLDVWNRANANIWFPERIPIINDLQASKLLTQNERDCLTRALVGLTFLDTLQAEKGLPNMQEDLELDAQKELHVLKQFEYMECLTKDHSLLTPNGWKSIDKITKNDLVAQYEPLNNSIEFVYPINISSHIENSTIIFECPSGGIYQRVSPKHRVYMEYIPNELRYNRNYSNDWTYGVKHAYELVNVTTNQYVRYRNSGHLSSKYERDFTELDAILVAIQAYGSIDNSTKNKFGEPTRNGSKSGTIPVRFAFSKQRKIDRIYWLANKLNWKISKPSDSTRDNHNKLNFVLYVPKEYLVKRDKKFINWWNLNELSFNWCRGFIMELSHWDDHYREKHPFVTYYSCDKDNAEFVMAISALSGYKARLGVSVDNRSDEFNDVYVVGISLTKSTTNSQSIIVEENNESVEVYGVEVPSTFLLIRSGDSTLITGNCIHSKSYSSIFSTILSTEEINSAFLWSEENKRLQHKGYLITEKYVGSCPLERRQSSVYLESFLFYSGFFYPLLLNDTKRLTNIADVIKLINRDEAIHGFYIGYKYQQMVKKESLERQAYLKERAYDMLVELFENEVEYAKELYDEVGLTDQVLKYMEFNANRALANLGYEPLFTVSESELNPIVLKGLSNGVNHDFFSLAGSSYTLMPTGDVDDSIKKDLLAHFNL